MKKSPIRGRKRKRNQKFSIDFINNIQVPLTNRFNALNEDENNIAESAENDTSPKKISVSPIVVTDHSSDIGKIAKELNIEYQLKILGIGRKIICKSIDDKKKLADALDDKRIHFYSHPENENKIFKAILTGLPEIDIAEIKQNLEQTKLTPIKIVMFNTESKNKMYLCHFNKKDADDNDVDMKSLKLITAVYHHIVKWMPFKPKQKGPTQCYRCCMYGHGASTCHRYQVCLLCSGPHETKNCTIDSAQNPVYKCFNCVSANLPHNHKATDSACPFRAKYELARSKTRDKNTRKPHAHQNQTTTVTNSQFVNAPPPQPLTTSFASHFASTSRSSAPRTQTQQPIQQQYHRLTNQRVSNVPQQATYSNNNSNDLFSIDELTDILINSINDLEKCTSKLDQLRVIANILRNVCK